MLTGDYGFMAGDRAAGGCDKPPISPDGRVEACPVGTSVAPVNLGDSYDPSRWVQHFHVGVIRNGDITLTGQLHYMQNYSQDDGGLLPMAEPPIEGTRADYDPDPRPETPFVDESRVRGDGRYDAYGATLGFRGGQWARGGIGVTHATAENAYALHGLNVSFVGDGETFSRDWIGPRSVDPETGDIVGSLWTRRCRSGVQLGHALARARAVLGRGLQRHDRIRLSVRRHRQQGPGARRLEDVPRGHRHAGEHACRGSAATSASIR